MTGDIPDTRDALATGAEQAFVTGRTGLAVMEVQAMHFGHVALLSWMRATCTRRILALGSCDKAGTPGHPFDFTRRKAMVDAVFGEGTFTFVPLNDIDATLPGDWTGYVMGKLEQMRLPAPTDYFAGSRLDARWYEPEFASLSGEGDPMGPGRVWAGPSGRTIHILDREDGHFPSARQVRDLIEMRDPEWRRYVPRVLWRYVDWNYPPEMRVALTGESPPERDAHPVGTRFVGRDGELLALKDDGRWRPLGARRDEKADHARAAAARRARQGRQ